MRFGRCSIRAYQLKQKIAWHWLSPALEIIDLLTGRGAVLSYSDPFVPCFSRGGRAYAAVGESDALADAPDCVVICTDHAHFNWAALVNSGLTVVDTRNALRGFSSPAIIPLSGRRVPVPAVMAVAK